MLLSKQLIILNDNRYLLITLMNANTNYDVVTNINVNVRRFFGFLDHIYIWSHLKYNPLEPPKI